MISRKGSLSLASMMKDVNVGRFADTALSKIQNGIGNNNGSSQESVRPSSSRHDSANPVGAAGVSSSSNSKAANLKQLKDFIRSNPDVKQEVEQILKETHTVLPGL
nr:hypothetical protein [Paenibacillus lactis]